MIVPCPGWVVAGREEDVVHNKGHDVYLHLVGVDANQNHVDWACPVAVLGSPSCSSVN